MDNEMPAAQMQKILIAVLISLLSIIILSCIANAQPAPTATGTLRGAVAAAAPNGQSYNVAGASLKLKTPTQNLDAVTDDAGDYQFTNLLPGAYTLKATVQGFKTASKIVTIRAGVTSVENISLEVADVTATVTATSSTSGQGVKTSETAPTTTLKQNDLHTLPLPNEQLLDAPPLVRGVLRSAKGESSIQGATEQQSASLIAGANTNDPATGDFRLNLFNEGAQARQLQVANTDAPSPASRPNAPAPAASAQQQKSNDIPGDPTARLFELVLPSEHLLGDWGGLRTKLEESGITPRLILVTDLAGNPTGGRSQGATAPSSVELSLFFDLEKIFGLKGGSIFGSFSERWGHSLSAKYIGNTFSTQQIFGFQTYRVIDVSYQQKLFEDRVELRLGRFAVTDDFLVSPYNFGFMQNAFCGNPFGILLDAPGMSAYYGT
jgi:hypothetical protein